MSAFTYLLAVALLTSSPDKPVPAVSPEAAARLQPIMQQLALRWEILDPREVKYVLMRPEDFASDLDMLRRRYHDLAGAPFVCDSLRFPTGPPSPTCSASTAPTASTSTSANRWSYPTGRDARCPTGNRPALPRSGTRSAMPAVSTTTSQSVGRPQETGGDRRPGGVPQRQAASARAALAVSAD